MSDISQRITRLHQIKKRMDDSGPVVMSGPRALVDAFAQKDDDIRWLIKEVERLRLRVSEEDVRLAEECRRLQGRYQVAASKQRRSHMSDARMINDGRVA